MTHSLRSLFHIMLAAWFALVFLMALALMVHLPSETSGSLVENLFTHSVPPPPAPVLQKKAPHPQAAAVSPPKPAPASPWRKLEQGRSGGTGTLGKPEIIEEGDSIELIFPFKGTPGEITFYRRVEKGSLSVDLHGDLRLQQVVARVLTQGFLHRLQVYPHPGFIRISGTGRTPDLLKHMNGAAYVAGDRLRVVFTLDKEASVASPTQQNAAQEKNHAPAAPL
ncbi:MAG: hypothetical protein LBQ81_14175 [Zoogloeaceae bacterium]|jgi:hypothetical protein|nr:hypothetical protein [Zoogloeaceae bacterium]